MTRSRLFLFVLAMAFTASIAQGQSTSIGIAMGPTMSDLRGTTNQFLDGLYDFQLGFASEANFTWRFAKNFGVRTGIGYERKGAKLTATFTDENGNPLNDGDIRNNLDYIQVPILLELRFGKKVQGLFYLGQSFGYLFHQHQELPINTENIYRGDWNGMVGVGLEIPLNESFHFQTQIRFAHGLSDLMHGSIEKLHNYSSGLYIGAQYFLN